VHNTIVVKEQGGSDVERDATRIACLPPAKLHLPSDSPVVQIACGLHHSVLLLQNGQVPTNCLLSHYSKPNNQLKLESGSRFGHFLFFCPSTGVQFWLQSVRSAGVWRHFGQKQHTTS
jgi:hypothetical protein